jgi:cytochrome b
MPHASSADADLGSPPPILVWDLPTRLFHWSLATAVTAAALIAYLGPAWWLDLHLAAGYLVGLLLGLRLVWGLFGGEESRFRSFCYSAAELARHLRGLLRGHPPRYRGHNPAGALMIFTLLAVLTGMLVSGLLGLGGVEQQGPLAGLLGYAGGRLALDIHAVLALILLFLVAGHLAGVLIESLLSRENLVTAMITGRKQPLPGRGAPAPAQLRPALLGLGLLALAVGLGLLGLARLPAPTARILPEPPIYREECGACHWPPHPSLLPAASWQRLLDGLDNHFGEMASLEPARADAITRYLTSNAAATWDTKVANNLRRVAPDQPERISATPYWLGRHRDVPGTAFRRPEVGGRVNCHACHRDADQGLFAPQAIHLD